MEKPEGITVLDMDPGQMRAAVLFDGLPNGTPHIAAFRSSKAP